jgi:exodeoxyribonuclease VII small subunit
MAEKKEKTIEETFGELEEIIKKLESGESSLEESFQYYENGMKLVKSCSDKIDKVEKKIMVLEENGESDEL